MFQFQTNCVFFFHHPNASSSAQAASELGARKAQQGPSGEQKHADGWESKREEPFPSLRSNQWLAKQVPRILCVQDILASGCLRLMPSVMSPPKKDAFRPSVIFS